ncbi:Lar family restriction alleviation protein [Oscillibacter ruminantium]|uniref:Lar family restriction alleviation protein n=1 Tax=Oscillibacter ruminantium TaxID=1263547 RepID=UPI00058CBB51|nr:Lar family restriction alleviation protein [Oscillibacter ruminantium]
MSELKPCPCCDADNPFKRAIPEVGIPSGDSGYRVTIKCRDCGCSITRWALKKAWAIESAEAAWNRRAQPDNAPLTLDELRGMDGEPVYIVGRLYGGWTVPWRNAAKYIARCPDEANISHYPKDYGKTWLAYRTKPEPPERS